MRQTTEAVVEGELLYNCMQSALYTNIAPDNMKKIVWMTEKRVYIWRCYRCKRNSHGIIYVLFLDGGGGTTSHGGGYIQVVVYIGL